jgi:hypothetical protein
MKVREVIALVEADGWVLVRTRGGHRQYKHPTKPQTASYFCLPLCGLKPTVSAHRNPANVQRWASP